MYRTGSPEGKKGGFEAGRIYLLILREEIRLFSHLEFAPLGEGVVELYGLPTSSGKNVGLISCRWFRYCCTEFQIVDLECAAVEILRVLFWFEILIICHCHDY